MLDGISTLNVSASANGYTAFQLNIARVVRSDANSSIDTPAAPPVDRVELSNSATSGSNGTAAPPAGTTENAGTPPNSVPPSTGTASPSVEQRAAALAAFLDADQDGSITQEEFVDGAKSLLRRGHRQGHREHAVGESDGAQNVEGTEAARRVQGHHHGRGRLGARLRDVFSYVDGDKSGTVDVAELASALARASQAGAPSAPGAPPATGGAAPPASNATAPATTPATNAGAGTGQTEHTTGSPVPPPQAAPPSSRVVSITTVRYVAIQQYAAVGQLN